MRTPATRFEDLVVWQKAHQFVLAAYRLSRTFPRSETYGLSSQFRRAAVSIAANIAEGFKKRGKSDELRFSRTLSTAMFPSQASCLKRSASCWRPIRGPF